ncbi:XdhC family protein [Microbacterium sp. P03]|uniref:XdhC family protein n=1 Tax=Microbacterium sp. P03 TaxID=3366946 RepID=UPI0037475852
MLELAEAILPRLRAGERVAIVTVTRVARSAPRGVGSSMAVTETREVIGAISGGCVEGDAVALAVQALRSGRAQTASFGFSDETAHAAGLACGGAVDVVAWVVAPDDDEVVALLERASAGRPTTVGLITRGPSAGLLCTPRSLRESGDLEVADALALAETVADTRLLAFAPDAAILALSRAPRPRLIVLGAGEHAAALCRIGAASGFAVTVCDAWELLVTPDRFPEATELVVALPHEYLATTEVDARTAVCVLTHDERLDVPALEVALRLPVAFVGAMGARRTVARRAALLRAAGLTDGELERLHSPLGLDLGGATVQESAIAALAEIVAARHGGSGVPLRTMSGPIHRSESGTGAGAAVTVAQCLPDSVTALRVPSP